MAQNKKFTSTINLKGQADFSDIINSIKQLRQKAEKTGNASDLLGIDKQIEKIDELQIKIQHAIEKGFSKPEEFKQFDKMTNDLLKTASNLSVKFQNIHLSGLEKEVNAARDSLKDAEKNLSNISKTQQQVIANQLKGVTNGKQYAQTFVEAAKQGRDLQDVQKEIAKELDNQVKKQKALQALAASDVSSARQRVEQSTNKARSLEVGGGLNKSNFQTKSGQALNQNEYNAVKDAYQQAVRDSSTATAAISKFRAALKNLQIDGQQVAIQFKDSATVNAAFANSFDIIENELKPAQKELHNYSGVLDNANKATQQAIQDQANFNANSNNDNVVKGYQNIINATKDFSNANQTLQSTLRNAENTTVPQGIQDYNEQLEQAKERTEEAKDATLDMINSQEDLDLTFDNLKDTVTQILSFTTALDIFRDVVTQTFEDIKNLDKSFAEIAMVTDYSVQDMWDSYDDYAKMAKDLGQSTESVIKASGLFYQQGLDTAQSLELTESTMKLATLAGLDFEEATSQMTAALRGFHMEMNQGEHITDVYSELAAKAAADVNGIAYAMSKTASIANSAGMSFENTSAFLTQMIETTQEAPSIKILNN